MEPGIQVAILIPAFLCGVPASLRFVFMRLYTLVHEALFAILLPPAFIVISGTFGGLRQIFLLFCNVKDCFFSRCLVQYYGVSTACRVKSAR